MIYKPRCPQRIDHLFGAGRNLLNTVLAYICDIIVLKNRYMVTFERKWFGNRAVKFFIGIGDTDDFGRVLACVDNYFGLLDHLYLALADMNSPQ